jgi:hypothetical protein
MARALGRLRLGAFLYRRRSYLNRIGRVTPRSSTGTLCGGAGLTSDEGRSPAWMAGEVWV